jgi:hypothetical protein
VMGSASCSTTHGVKSEAKMASPNPPRSALIESYALWEPGTKVDKDVLKRGARTRGATKNGY